MHAFGPLKSQAWELTRSDGFSWATYQILEVLIQIYEFDHLKLLMQYE